MWSNGTVHCRTRTRRCSTRWPDISGGSTTSGVRCSRSRHGSRRRQTRPAGTPTGWTGTAQETYQDVRRSLDTLISAVQITTPTANNTLAPGLTDIERTLEEANVRLYIERAGSQLELGWYLVEYENYDQAADVLERARQLHLRAEGQSDAVKRADAFAFGRQRKLTEDLERFEWTLKTVAAEPVRQANEATVMAEATGDTDTVVEYWETAVRRYDDILDLDWWRDIQDRGGDRRHRHRELSATPRTERDPGTLGSAPDSHLAETTDGTTKPARTVRDGCHRAGTPVPPTVLRAGTARETTRRGR